MKRRRDVTPCQRVWCWQNVWRRSPPPPPRHFPSLAWRRPSFWRTWIFLEMNELFINRRWSCSFSPLRPSLKFCCLFSRAGGDWPSCLMRVSVEVLTTFVGLEMELLEGLSWALCCWTALCSAWYQEWASISLSSLSRTEARPVSICILCPCFLVRPQYQSTSLSSSTSLEVRLDQEEVTGGDGTLPELWTVTPDTLRCGIQHQLVSIIIRGQSDEVHLILYISYYLVRTTQLTLHFLTPLSLQLRTPSLTALLSSGLSGTVPTPAI